MKNLSLFLFTIAVVSFFGRSAWALTMTPSPKPDQEVTITASGSASLESSPEASIKNLRDRIASKVAELRKRDEQAVSGEISAISDNELTIESIFGKKETIQLDEALTKYYRFTGSAREEIAKTDIKVGQYIVVLGPRSNEKIIANEVLRDELYQIKSGRVTEVNPSKSTFKLETYEKESITVTIEGTSAIQSLNTTTGGITTGSFARIKEGDTAHVVFRVISITQKLEQVTASRMLHIPVAYFAK